MSRLLLTTICLLLFLFSDAQTGFLFVKKGIKKKATYTEGQSIVLRLQNDSLRYGLITGLVNDTIFLNGSPVPRTAVKEVLLSDKKDRAFRIPLKDFLLITAGVGLVTAGLTLSNQADFKEALTAGIAIGYVPLAFGYLKSKISLKRRKYRIGKKFRLQMIDFYVPGKRGF
jgi:hypothetical protein